MKAPEGHRKRGPFCVVVQSHARPRAELSVGAAHQVMRDHLMCRAFRCPRKHAAYWVLVDARRIAPDQRVESRRLTLTESGFA
jgi:hypothetical protein